MTTVQFRTDSSATFASYSAVIVEVDYENDETVYNDMSWNNKKIVNASWKKWNIKFSRLSETQMDALLALKKEEEPQMSISSTTYDIVIKAMSMKAIGATITVINKTKET